MKPHSHYFLFSILILPILWLPFARPKASRQPAAFYIQPVLKWSRGGCDWPWCETGWYSSPAVADLDGDGTAEVIGANERVFVLDGKTGTLEWEAATGHDRDEPEAGAVGRTWPDVVVADLEGDGDLEIVTAHGDGYLSVYDHQGYFAPGWPQQLTPGDELRSLGVADLEGDSDLEILAASTRSQDQWFVLEHTGALRSGDWPQHRPDSDTNGWTAGCYNQNLAAGDLDGDGRAEILGPNDTHYLAAFQDDGIQMRASSLYGSNPDGTAKVWSRVGVHVDQAVDLRGYAECGLEHRPNFAHSAPLAVDVDYNGQLEAVVVGNVYNCGADPYASLYEMPFLFNGDRTRWHSGSYDWTVLPEPDAQSAPLSEDYDRIENSHPNPVAADLDADGRLEILFPSYDGRLHAYWLDRQEHGAWPYAVTIPGEGVIRFASEPAVADLDGNGTAEVIFVSWVEKGSGQNGRLHILDYLGHPLKEVDLPAAPEGQNWNGALAAPTLAEIDGEPDLEVIVNTAQSGLAAYDLAGSKSAYILWGTGRGSFQRSGSLVTGNLFGSALNASRGQASPGDSLTYTVVLRNPGPPLDSVQLRDSLPAGVTFAGNLSASAGAVQESGGLITWTGSVPPGQPVTIRWKVTIREDLASPAALVNEVQIEDGLGGVLRRGATTLVGGTAIYLPLLQR